MQRSGAAILVLIVLVACATHVGTPAAGERGCVVAREVQEAAAEFRALRSVRGHFQGGEPNADVDTWMGRKHQLMIDLGTRLGAGGCSRAQVVALMGDPDQVARKGDVTFEQVRDLADFPAPAGDAYELLVYEWRGNHDFLYLVDQGGAITGSGWWYAGE
jgi:hypothetical protein